jgi:hypothetical protein
MRTTLLDLIRTAATVLLGLYAGGVFFVVLAPSLRRLPGDAYVRYWQSLNTDYARAMPPMLLTCLALMVATCALSYRHGRLVFTVTQMEPLNRLADTWDPTQLPADWAEVRQRWLTLHTARTVIAVLAFIAFLAANTLDRTPAASAKAGPLTERPPVAAAP